MSRPVVDSVRDVLREYDLIVRLGGDEFLVGLMDLPVAVAAVRFRSANTSLAVTWEASMSVGLAELGPPDSLADLIGRADAAMYEARQASRQHALQAHTARACVVDLDASPSRATSEQSSAPSASDRPGQH